MPCPPRSIGGPSSSIVPARVPGAAETMSNKQQNKVGGMGCLDALALPCLHPDRHGAALRRAQKSPLGMAQPTRLHPPRLRPPSDPLRPPARLCFSALPHHTLSWNGGNPTPSPALPSICTIAPDVLLSTKPTSTTRPAALFPLPLPQPGVWSEAEDELLALWQVCSMLRRPWLQLHACLDLLARAWSQLGSG